MAPGRMQYHDRSLIASVRVPLYNIRGYIRVRANRGAAAALPDMGGKRMKVLLIDDEKLALEYLEHIISWADYGFEIVGSVTDAEAALRIFRRNRPELVISDVYMQGMDGLDFVSAIREIDQNTHILFLSGYKNFDYVKKAIHLGIDDYLLKSDIDEELFLSKILKIREKIEKERQKKQYTEGIILKELFTRNLDEQAYKEILGETEYIRLHKKYYYMIFTPMQVPSFLEDYFSLCFFDDNYLDEISLRQLIQKQPMTEGLQNTAVFSIGEKEILAVFEIKGDPVSRKGIWEMLHKQACRILEEVNRGDNGKYSLFFYPAGCTVRQFGRFYRENKGQLGYCYVKEKPEVMEFGLHKILPQGQQETVNADRIYRAICDRDYGETEKYLAILTDAVRQGDYITYLWNVKETVTAMSRFETRVKGARSGRGFSLAESVNRFDLRNPYGMAEFIRYKLEEIDKIYHEKQDVSYSEAILKAMDYIRKNYAVEELSTNLVAKKVNLSISWLSTKFKEEVGVGISDYINDIRIQEAKRLFDEKEGGYMVYEVAEKVGFASSQYFSRIFKQITGFTPNEYRRVNRNKEK